MSQPQPEWNVKYQRYVHTVWNRAQRCYEWQHYVEGEGWVFLDWVPTNPQPVSFQPVHGQSAQYYPTQANDYSTPPIPLRQRIDSGAQPGSAKGAPINGTYDETQRIPGSHVEPLDDTYFVKPNSYYSVGKVFSILFSEAAGATATSYNDSISLVKHGEHVHSQIRRFIVVSPQRGFCYAVPIFTYGGKGTLKKGVDPNAHAVAYSEGYSPSLLPGEGSLHKKPICIVMQQGEAPLTLPSRIFFGIHHPIQNNVKAKDLGIVSKKDLDRFLRYWFTDDPRSQARGMQYGSVSG